MIFDSWLRAELRRRFRADTLEVAEDFNKRVTTYTVTCPDHVLRFMISDTEMVYARDLYALFGSKLDALAEQIATL